MQTQQMMILCILALGYLATAASPSLAQQEDIVFDPQSGNYIITYEAEGQLHQTVFVPGNKIAPTIKSKFSTKADGKIRYRYKIKSGKQSQQDISLFILIASRVDSVSLRTPHNWDGSIAPNLGNPGFRVGWSYWGNEKPDGIPPGKSLSGFGFDSPDLPGIGLVSLKGRTPILAFAGHGPSQEISDKLMEIRLSKDGVALPAAIPGILVTEPFDAVVVLAALQKHIQDDLVPIEQIDPVFAAQLDRLFATAIAAVNQGNLTAARSDIKELRHLLKKKHGDVDEEDDKDEKADDDEEHNKGKTGLITKLAAKVLVFDLKYIEKRLKHE